MVQAQDLTPLEDPGELHLKVVSAERVQQIEDVNAHVVNSASPGAQLVVVTLEGSVQKPCRLQLESGEFAVAFEFEAGTGVGGSLLKEERVHRSLGVSIGDGGWTAARDPIQGSALFMARFPEAGKVTIRAAFIMPETVSEFTVRCPASAGRAKVSKIPQQRPPGTKENPNIDEPGKGKRKSRLQA
jgi:hypothetical protein